MHVLILNQTFHPDVAATGQLMWDLARHLGAGGHRVSVVTSRNFYGTDRRHEHAFERVGRVEIHRLGGTAFGKKNLAGRLADFASFYLAAARHLFSRPVPDVVLALTSPPMVASLAALLKQFRRRPDGRRVGLVYHVMDLYPDALPGLGMTHARSPLYRLLRRLSARTFALSDGVVALGHDMADRITRRYLHPSRRDRVHVVQPWADGASLYPLDKSRVPLARELGLLNTFTAVYSGNLGLAHDVDTLVQAIRLTRDDRNLCWLFVGGGKRLDALRAQAKSARWPHVRFLPFQDREKLNDSLNLADVHLVSQLPAFTGVVVPSKLFGILAVGKPAVVVGPGDAECSRVIREAGCGFVVPNGDAAELVRRLRQLRDDEGLRRETGRRGREAFERSYDKPVALARLTNVLQSAAAE